MAKRGRGIDATGRSKKGPRHVRLHHWLMQSAAWQSLTPIDRCILIELYALYNGENNGDVFLSGSEAAKRVGCGRRQAYEGLRRLEERGFIRPRQRGSFSLKVRHATTWILTEFSFNDDPPTKDFMSWRPKIQNTVSPEDTAGTPRGHRGRAAAYDSTPDGVPRGYREPENRPSTVSSGNTQVVYQVGGSAKSKAKNPTEGQQQQSARVASDSQDDMPDIPASLRRGAA